MKQDSSLMSTLDGSAFNEITLSPCVDLVIGVGFVSIGKLTGGIARMKKIFGLKKKADQTKGSISGSAGTIDANDMASAYQVPPTASAPPAAVPKSNQSPSGSYSEVLKAMGGEDKTPASSSNDGVPGKAEFLEGEQRLNLSRYHEALDFYELSAELGYAPAKYRIFNIHVDILKDWTDEKVAEYFVHLQEEPMWWCQDWSLKKDPIAFFFLGYHEYYLRKEYREGLKFFLESAKLGYSNGQHMVGVCYLKGMGVDQDEREAVKWFEMAAAQEHAKSELNLALAYKNGTGGLKANPKKAFELIQRSANKNLPAAMNALGNCFLKGECGVRVDEKRAYELFLDAAKKGEPNAQCSVGFCLSQGKGVSKDKAAAIGWYKKAADQGNEVAKKNLQTMSTGTKKKVYHYNYSYRY